MEKLHFTPGRASGDPDERVISDSDIEKAKAEGSAMA